jgi:hypothetical protein
MMRNQLLLAVMAIYCAGFAAADGMSSLNVKEGLWEVSVTHSMSGMPSAPNIPPDALAKMPPDQRAKIEAMMGGKPTVTRQCVTKEKLQQHTAFSNARGDCTYNVTNSTATKVEAKFHCTDKGGASDGNYLMEATGLDSVKGTAHIVTNADGHNMTMDFTITSKYLGAACGDVK